MSPSCATVSGGPSRPRSSSAPPTDTCASGRCSALSPELTSWPAGGAPLFGGQPDTWSWPPNGWTFVGSATSARTVEYPALGSFGTVRGDPSVADHVVAELQRELRDAGYHIDDPAGYYGNTTEHAVRAFQRVEGITVDGIYGPETRGAMMDGMRGVMASFTTPLQPGQNRNVNIHLGADYIHGDVIRPGETYSLNAGIGRRTRARGFVEDGFIDEGDITTVVGGGVSQLATTMVNATWFSGIDLIDFRQHTIYFERYPMCREGTLDWNDLDVVVRNNSPHMITISSTYSSTGVTLTFVGEPWAAVSSWTGDPYDISGPGGAFSVTCGRTILFPDGHRHSEDYFWRYHEGYPG